MDMAMRAARANMYVFPVEAGGKRPVMTPRGRLQWGALATTDVALIQDWWTRYCSDANYGIACKPSKLIVVDCDQFKEGKEIPPRFAKPGVRDGIDILERITEDLGVDFPDDTMTIMTPSGGQHLMFKNPDNLPMRNSSIVPGFIDIRANGGQDGGFIVGPGSIGSNGRKYEVLHRAPLMAAPDWLLQLCSPPPVKPRPPTPVNQGPKFDGPAKFDGLINAVRNATVNRNDKLNWAAHRAAQDGMPYGDALRDFAAAALECGLDQHEIEPTIRSAYRGMGV